MKFSILMSIYDKEVPSNLIDCLDSLSKQTIKANELVLVYDGPISKELSDIIDMYKDILNIRIIKIPKNVGLGKALNVGMTSCNNELIARMDTDDICTKDRFEIQLSALKKNPEIRVLGTGITEFDEDGNTRNKILPLDNLDILSFLKKKNPINHMSVIFYKSDVIRVGGYQHHLFMEDYNLWIRLANSGVIFSNVSNICVRVRVGNEMIKRRKGISYIKSEYQLFLLKNKFKIIKPPAGLVVFFVRSLIRLLPNKLLSLIYNMNRS